MRLLRFLVSPQFFWPSTKNARFYFTSEGLITSVYHDDGQGKVYQKHGPRDSKICFTKTQWGKNRRFSCKFSYAFIYVNRFRDWHIENIISAVQTVLSGCTFCFQFNWHFLPYYSVICFVCIWYFVNFISQGQYKQIWLPNNTGNNNTNIAATTNCK